MPNDTAAHPQQTVDLCADIQRSVKKEPMDRVKCVHVFDDYYRCNWWAPLTDPAAGHIPHWAVAATHYIRKSAFFKATNHGGQVAVEEVLVPARDDG